MGHAADRGSPGISAHMEVVQHLGNENFGSTQPGLLTKSKTQPLITCVSKKGAAADRG